MDRTRGISFASALSIVVGVSLGACSPYVYKEEIGTFSDGVKDSLRSFNALKPTYTAWATEQRNRQLLEEFVNNGTRPSVSDACLELRLKYETAFAAGGAPGGELISEADYAACMVTPVPRTDPDGGRLSNLEALSGALNNYIAGLLAVTDAEDENTLQRAFGELNTSATALVSTVNEELLKRNQETLDAFGSLVYEGGLAYLRHRRFEALKEAANNTDEAVGKAADLLAEAAFDIYGPVLTDKERALDKAQRQSLNVTANNYVQVWSDIKSARATYIQALRDSPIYAFHGIKSTHSALRDSLNDPTNRKQLEALYENAVALKKAAEGALEAIHADDG
ncbi:hypothetical protein [Nitrococcus mobilis]|uniref:Lipoprotein n=1 Tax=Nitrococcus mobilis Nb-231 TaxID=314278 RepID=A4BQZ2_9GAMM|nr:hypothetical protein [Nitrococcus mobilis]EAR21992.1 hypothetical protein NB231_06376 [Nitrococcus mobilis Nb-231]